ncbi:MAG: enoyl-CoA hydratase/isomerase family protein [Syntrophomonadaceae bacterium]
MSYQVQIEDQIAVFTFTAPTGAVSGETLRGLGEVLARVDAEEDLKGLVLTGAGKFFSSGFDLKTFTSFRNEKEIIEWFKYEEEVMHRLFTCSKPVIAAVNGHATAAGMIICMACDYRLALDQEKIKIGMTEIKIGLSLTPAEGEIMRFGLDTDKNFRDMIMGGELISPQKAVARGFFDELAATPEELIQKAKSKVCDLIDTPGRPFIDLKQIEKKHAAAHIVTEVENFDWNILTSKFTNPKIIAFLAKVQEGMDANSAASGSSGGVNR